MAEVPDSTIELAKGFSTSLICDALVKGKLGDPNSVLLEGLTALSGSGERVVGRARTEERVYIRDNSQNALVKDRALAMRFVDECEAGDFLVSTGPPEDRGAIFGGMMALTATRRGAVGVLVNGKTRDIQEISEGGFPLWARGLTPVAGGAAHYSVSQVNSPIRVDGIEVVPGDLVVADADGIVVLPSEIAVETIAKCEELRAAEAASEKAIAAGASMSDAYPSKDHYAK
jgi:regulator of RNase E activity RraA